MTDFKEREDDLEKGILSVMFPKNNNKHAPCSPGCCDPVEDCTPNSGPCGPNEDACEKDILDDNEIIPKRSSRTQSVN